MRTNLLHFNQKIDSEFGACTAAEERNSVAKCTMWSTNRPVAGEHGGGARSLVDLLLHFSFPYEILSTYNIYELWV